METVERVARLEERVDGVEKTVECMKSEVNEKIDGLERRFNQRLEESQKFFVDRDNAFSKNMWKLIFWLVYLMGAIIGTFLGLKFFLPKIM